MIEGWSLHFMAKPNSIWLQWNLSTHSEFTLKQPWPRWQGNRLLMTYRFIIQISPIDAYCCDWQLGLKARAISIELRQPVGNRDNGLSSLPCFHTFSAVTETSLIASLPRQHPINLLNKGWSPAVLFAENREDPVRPHWKGKRGNWGWISLIVAGKLSLLKTNNIRNLIAALEIDGGEVWI